MASPQNNLQYFLNALPDKRVGFAFTNIFKRTRVIDPGLSVGILAGATLSATGDKHAGRVINLNALTGSVVTLPAAIGSGDKYRFFVSVLATSNSHIVKVASATDFFVGTILSISTTPATTNGWIAANSGTVSTNSDTVTLNRTTSGSVTVGEYFDVQDVGTATWTINGVLTQSGVAVTPFSAGV